MEFCFHRNDLSISMQKRRNIGTLIWKWRSIKDPNPYVSLFISYSISIESHDKCHIKQTASVWHIVVLHITVVLWIHVIFPQRSISHIHPTLIYFNPIKCSSFKKLTKVTVKREKGYVFVFYSIEWRSSGAECILPHFDL